MHRGMSGKIANAYGGHGGQLCGDTTVAQQRYAAAIPLISYIVRGGQQFKGSDDAGTLAAMAGLATAHERTV